MSLHDNSFYKLYADRYTYGYDYQGEGLCVNQNGINNEFFKIKGRSGITLQGCMDRCDNTEGCGAVSYYGMKGYEACWGTTDKASIRGIRLDSRHDH